MNKGDPSLIKLNIKFVYIKEIKSPFKIVKDIGLKWLKETQLLLTFTWILWQERRILTASILFFIHAICNGVPFKKIL